MIGWESLMLPGMVEQVETIERLVAQQPAMG